MHPCIEALLSPIFNRSIKQGDDPDDIRRKKILIMTAFVPFTCIPSIKSAMEDFLFLLIAFMTYLFFSMFTLIYLTVLQRDPTDAFVAVVAVGHCTAISLHQFHATLVQGIPVWPLFVLIVDILLVCQAPSRSSVLVVCWCCLFVLVIGIESSVRFGLFDIKYQGYGETLLRGLYDCDDLPCPRDFVKTMNEVCVQWSVLVVDFVCTRGFALAVLQEKNTILASIDTANSIATSLSRFDLEQATTLLQDADIPQGLSDAFEQILCNLRSYKPYLPQSCIPAVYSDSESEEEESSQTASEALSEELEGIVSLCLKKKFENVSASLMIVNICNSISVLQTSHDTFGSLISDLVTATSEIIVKHRGTLDLFLGDRVFANFGALRVHVSHPRLCTEAAMSIESLSGGLLEPYQKSTSRDLSISIGLASGNIVCGDLGSEDVMRFSIIGKMSLLVGVVERVASMKGVPILSESGLYNHVKHTVETRVFLQTVVHDDTVHLLYEIIPSKADTTVVEWMYQLEEAGAGKWDAFNKVAVALLTGTQEPDVSKLSIDIPQHDELCRLVEKGCPDPFVVVKR
eukprot:TRINITY_DN10842_c0_g1_i4.p1 TRINITY_DN10842_c0_g1~~TRINITY_DN10842_c0_g1_i4.p1  ORF type:complete len:595 (+),score=100.57 TRINITY_DN10842_c0_g1_i4:71-1786(+)